MKKSILTLAVLLFSLAAFAQSAEKISELLTSKKATFAQAAYLAAALTDDSAELTEEAAFTKMVQAGAIRADRKADDAITLKELAKLYMQATGLKGGLFYTLFGTPRYAYRELKAQGIIPEQADPSQQVTGRETIAVLNGCLSLTGGAQ